MKTFQRISLILIIVVAGCAPTAYQTRSRMVIPKDKPVDLVEIQTMIQGFEPNPLDIKNDTSLIPATYYKKAWNYLFFNARAKSAEEQLQILEPWLVSTNYSFNSLPEKLFLVDILAWASTLHIQMEDRKLCSLASFSSAAILHSCLSNIRSRYFSNTLGSIKSFDRNSLSRMEREIEQEKQILSGSMDNIIAGRNLLQTLGYVAFYIEGIDLYKELFSAQLETDSLQNAAINKISDNFLNEFTGPKSSLMNRYTNLIAGIFSEDKDSWPALYALNLFPDKRPLEQVVQMPRFYDYESGIEDYINKYPDESIELANKWLSGKEFSEEQKARAFFILGFFEKVMNDSVVDKDPDLGNLNYFKYYYHIRIDSVKSTIVKESHISEANSEPGLVNDPTIFDSDIAIRGFHEEKKDTAQKDYKTRLIEEAASPNLKALVLYNRVSGEDETPTSLETMLENEIMKKQFTENEVLHIYSPVIQGLSQEKQEELIDAMYNSYNSAWQKVAEVFYNPTLANKINKEYIESILNGSVPWKKVTLIKYLAKSDTLYKPYIIEFLKGSYYTTGDKEIIRRNLKNLYTKDIAVGYNQTINWNAVDKAVNLSELKYRSMLILSASEILDALNFVESVSIIKSKFIGDDMLCLAGANWIVSNYDSTVVEKPNFIDVAGNTRLQKAVIAFLSAYFSEKPDYSKYIFLTNLMRNETEWKTLAGLGINNVSKELFSVSEEKQQYFNPVESITLKGIVNNIKNRYMLLLSVK